MARGLRGARGLVLLTVAALALAVGVVSSSELDGASASPRAEASAKAPNLAERLLLRLHDLPLGYRLLDFGPPVATSVPIFGCAQIEPANPQPRLADFFERYSLRGCMIAYHRLFRVSEGGPFPYLVGSGAAEVGSVEGAEAGLAVSRELLSRLKDEPLKEVPPPETVGDATRLFHWQGPGLFASAGETISVVVWRSGGSLAIILAADWRAADSDSAAFELARRQQHRLEAPTPYLPAEYDDTEVALEDPALRVPVYWLGKTYASSRGLPRLRLADSESHARAHRGARVSLFYTDRLDFEDAEAVQMETWTRRQWEARRGSRRPPFSLGCRKTRRLDLARGGAILYEGLRGKAGCNKAGHRRHSHVAVVHVEGIVIVIRTLSICEVCVGPGVGPYNSFRGMAAVARGLELRLKPGSAPVATP